MLFSHTRYLSLCVDMTRHPQRLSNIFTVFFPAWLNPDLDRSCASCLLRSCIYVCFTLICGLSLSNEKVESLAYQPTTDRPHLFGQFYITQQLEFAISNDKYASLVLG